MSDDGKTGPIARAVMNGIFTDVEAEAEGRPYAFACSAEWLDDCYADGALPASAAIGSDAARFADHLKRASGEP